jgi:hypothetical protein
MANKGNKLDVFHPGQHNIVSWLQQFKFYAALHDYTQDKQKFLLLTNISNEVFETIKNLLAPTDLEDASISVKDLTDKLRSHYEVQVNSHVAVQTFQSIRQEPGENITGFALRLRKVANECSFGSTYDDRLKTQFIIGLADLDVKEKIYGNKKLTTFEHCLQAAVDKEQLRLQFQKLCVASTPNTNINAVGGQPRGQPSRPNNFQAASTSNNNFRQGPRPTFNNNNPRQGCRRCGRDHKGTPCPFVNTQCFYCGGIGHLKAVCNKKARGDPPTPRSNIKMVSQHEEITQPHSQQMSSQGQEQRSGFQITPDNQSSGEEHLYQVTLVNAAQGDQRSNIRVNVQLNDRPCHMDLDTGASESIMPWYQFSSLGFSEADLAPSNHRFRSYTKEIIPLRGVAQIQVSFANQKHQLPLYVVNQAGPALFGMSWVNKFGLQAIVNHVETADTVSLIQSISSASVVYQFNHLFDKVKSGTMRIEPAHLPLKPLAQPRYTRARPVPLALQDRLNQELLRLEEEGVIQPVTYSPWASPVVLVMKSDGGLRICGDYKAGVNTQLELQEYALPRVEDIFARLNGCTHFSKLDLSAAYNQIALQPEAKCLTTINTTKGLFQYQVLPFGIASAPAIFQRAIDQILNGLSCTFGYLDDIIVGGASAEIHDENLLKLLRRLDEHQVRLNKEKCQFGVRQIEYLGHVITREGLKPTASKVEAITKAPPPTDVKTLRAFLGLITYYGKFIAHLSSLLAPLSDLLGKDVQWRWGDKEQSAFEQAKKALTGQCCLAHYDPKASLIFHRRGRTG